MTGRIDARARSTAGRVRLGLARLAGVVVALLLAAPAVASADATLGTITQPANSLTAACAGDAIGQLTTDSSTPYTVPAGGGEITQWQMNVAGDTAGAPITFVVLRPVGNFAYLVVGDDSEVLPDPLPASNVATFTLSTPIVVSGGDTLGLYAAAGQNDPTCLWKSGSTPENDSLIALGNAVAPEPGQTLSEATNTQALSGPEFTLDLAATLANPQDASVTAGAPTQSAVAGHAALLTATVGNAGPASGPITFTDDVPAGLQIDSVAAGLGSCTTTGQQVSCTVAGLAPGQTAPVDIVVTPSTPGSYVDGVSVAPPSGITDPDPANNSASATLAVAAPPAAPAAPISIASKCVVPALKGINAAFAKRVLGLLGCRAGKVRKVHSHVAKGAVVRTSVRAGTYAAGQVVGLQVSSGPKPKPKH